MTTDTTHAYFLANEYLSRQERQERYLKDSPYFLHLVRQYGYELPLHAAKSAATLHGTTLDDLGFYPGASRIDALELVQKLGY